MMTLQSAFSKSFSPKLDEEKRFVKNNRNIFLYRRGLLKAKQWPVL
jgi:hypothetical protein